MVFIDTSAFYSFLDRDDSNHTAAESVWRDLLRQEQLLITNNYVIVETTALLQHRLGLAAVRAFVHDILPIVEVSWIHKEQHRVAAEVLLGNSRRKPSLVDCASFQTMHTQGIPVAFSFDRHFREQGFDLIPA